MSTGTEGGDDVIQEPKIIWEPKNGSASLSCRHNKDITYRQMYWYRQRPGETMRLIVFTVAGSEPDFGDVDKNKFETQKRDAQSGYLKVKDLETDDSAIYFCAVSNTAWQRLESAVQKHSVHKKTMTALVNRWQSGTTNVPHVKTI